MSQPLVSILIITMNHEKFIAQACQSAIAQTYPNLEIVLLDNKSKDDTFKNAKKTFENCKIPFKLIQNTESFGVAKNLNILVSHAKGKYVCLLSGDDWFANNMIEEKVKYMDLGYDFLLSDGYKYEQDTGKTVDAYSKNDKEKVIESLTHFFHENVAENKTVNMGTFVKREILEQHPFDENINTEDWDMNLRLTNLGYKIGFIDQKLFYYRVLSTSLSRNWEVMADSYKKVTSKYLEYIKADKELLKKYEINLLKYKYENLLADTKSGVERKLILENWKKEKYKIRYSQPILFLKLLLLKVK